MRRTVPSFLVALWVMSAWFGGTGVAAAAASPDGRPALRVLTSFLPVHSMAVAIAGSRASVENWLPAGVDPHDFQFSPADLRRLREADVLIAGGLGLEGWTEARLRRMSGNDRLRLVEAGAVLPGAVLIHDACRHDHDHDHGHDHDHSHHGGPNPHFWLDPLLMAHAVGPVAAAMSEMDPAGAAVYQENAVAYASMLYALHREYAAGLHDRRSVPFITYHNAFPYLAKRYGLRLVGVVEGTAAEEPSARELAELSRLVRQEGVRVLFTDGSPTRLARRLAADLKIEVATLETLETGDLVPEAYESGMRRNLKALQASLRPGTIP
ncbi:MAG: zinc ABC transporter substrate-binding protein [Verrucomicrobiae bacterium]|nr:zinc ABC transporter substrate-binding protein [Verrucomicrobiae bacterium]